jgi:hypothetical protein
MKTISRPGIQAPTIDTGHAPCFQWKASAFFSDVRQSRAVCSSSFAQNQYRIRDTDFIFCPTPGVATVNVRRASLSARSLDPNATDAATGLRQCARQRRSRKW